MHRFKLAVIHCLISLTLLPAAIAQPPQPAATRANTATTPAPRKDGWWNQRHEAMNARVKQGNVDLVFIGDSITQGWEGDGAKDIWAKDFAPLHAVNLGIGGDRTEQVLWRLDNGNLEGISPKAAVIMIGTNNSNGSDNTSEEIAAGIKAIVEKVRVKSPTTHVLLLAIFPRGEKPNPQREKIEKVNVLISALDDGRMVHYLDIGHKFLQPDGTLTKEIMPDFLHLSPKGYQIWADNTTARITEYVNAKSIPAVPMTPIKPAPGQKAQTAPVTLHVGDAAPALTVDSFVKGEEVKTLAAGKVYVVEFWATWCGPCIESIPHLTELQHKHKDVVCIGVASSERQPAEGAADTRLEGVKSFIAKQGDKMDYRVAYDSKRAMSNSWMKPAGQNTIPTAFIVDSKGKIAFIGHPNEMEAALAKVVAAK